MDVLAAVQKPCLLVGSAVRRHVSSGQPQKIMKPFFDRSKEINPKNRMVSAVPWLSCKKPDGLAPILQNVDAFFQITREDAVFVNKRRLMMVFI